VVGAISITSPKSFFCGAAGALRFALPAAVGASLAFGKRPVIALAGDGSANYSITGLWTAAWRPSMHGWRCCRGSRLWLMRQHYEPIFRKHTSSIVKKNLLHIF
jgi:thiamine pyrophosphate-dependent acetolactate synthase large subunit-like protein